MLSWTHLASDPHSQYDYAILDTGARLKLSAPISSWITIEPMKASIYPSQVTNIAGDGFAIPFSGTRRGLRATLARIPQ
jgi:hypothetical protein